MRNIILITILAILIAVSAGYFSKQKKKNEGLGKFVKSNRPPRLRIVYSRKNKGKELITVKNSLDAYAVFKNIWSSQMETREEMYILYLNNANHVLGYYILSVGGITGTVADLRLIFSVALESLSTSIVMAHNHPTGNLKPSNSDIILTENIKDAGKMMSVPLIDHLIISSTEYFSFADEGKL